MAKVITKNRRAFFDYEIINNYEAGIVLEGWEIKSIRNSNVSLKGAFCSFKGDELFVNNMNISQYMNVEGDCLRARKLLLNKRELKKIKTSIEEKGLTIIPLTLKLSSKGLAKIDIAVSKGKKLHDKREVIKKRDQQRISKSMGL